MRKEDEKQLVSSRGCCSTSWPVFERRKREHSCRYETPAEGAASGEKDDAGCVSLR